MRKLSPGIFWVLLGSAVIFSVLRGEWATAFISVITLILTISPYTISKHYRVRVPQRFLFAIAFFIYSTLFLGEVGGFYERFWWWDTILHAGSAVGFGLVGFVVLLLLFRSEKIHASPAIISIFAFSFSLAIGALWEIFEFTMDQLLGLNMQKSGLVDTMWDFIVNAAGALVASLSGYIYLTKGKATGLGGVIKEMVHENLHSN